MKCNKVGVMITKTYDESDMRKPSVSEWYKRFQENRVDDECPGLASTSTVDENVEKVK